MKKIFIQSNTFISRWTLLPDRKKEFMEIWEPLWRSHIDTMEEITHFVFYGWTRDPNVLLAIESYKSEAQLAELRKTEIFQSTVEKMLNCCSKPMEMELASGIDATDRSVFDLYPQGDSTVHPHGAYFGAIFL